MFSAASEEGDGIWEGYRYLSRGQRGEMPMANCCVGHPTPLPQTTTTPRPTVLMVGQCWPFPSLGSPAARHQNQGSSLLAMRRRKVPRMESRLDAFFSFSLHCQHLRVNSVGQRNPPTAWNENPTPWPSPPSNKEDRKPLPLTPFPFKPWRLGGLCLCPSSLQKKKCLGVKKRRFHSGLAWELQL